MDLNDQLHRRARRSPAQDPDLMYAAATRRARRVVPRGKAAAAAVAAAAALAAFAVVISDGGSDDTDLATGTAESTETSAPSGTDSVPSSTTTTSVAVEPAGVVVFAGPDGVTITGPDGTTTAVTTEPSSSAYPLPNGTVVHQAAAEGSPVYPPDPDGPVLVWDGTASTPLPTDPDATPVLLDAAATADGPVALISERIIGAGRDDTTETLVLVDVTTGERTVVMSRPAFEAFHSSGAVLDDGDVIGLYTVDASAFLARWSAGQSGPTWETFAGSEASGTLVATADTSRVIDATGSPSGGHTINVAAFDTQTGQDGPGARITVPAEAAISTGLFCRARLDDGTLLCGWADGPPVAVDPAGTVGVLDGPRGSLPVR